jgi:hypothetical protein
VSSSFTPDEIRAAAHTHKDLGPEYEGAVIESFLEKVGREIDARVDDRIDRMRHHGGRGRGEVAHHHHHGPGLGLPIITIVLGIPLTAIVVAAGSRPVGFNGLVILWAALTVINVAYAISNSRGREH